MTAPRPTDAAATIYTSAKAPPRIDADTDAATTTRRTSNKRKQQHPPLSPSTLLSRATIRRAQFLPQSYTLQPKASARQQENSAPTTKPPPQPRTDASLYLWSSLVAGAGSGILASIVCAPLDVLRTRMQVWGDVSSATSAAASSKVANTPQRHLIVTMLRSIWTQEGWRGGFRGLGATLITVPLFWSIYFPTYDWCKATASRYDSRSYDSDTNQQYTDTAGHVSHSHKHNNNPLLRPALIHCGSAILAGGLADVICNPLFLVRTRLQTEFLHHATTTTKTATTASSTSAPPPGMWSTMQDLYRTGGWRIFWRGMTASLFGLSHVAVQFPIYEFLKAHPYGYYNPNIDATNTNGIGAEQPTTSTYGLLWASGVSKLCASLLTYPHEVVRARMMDSRVASTTSAATTTTSAAAIVRLWPTIVRLYQHEGIRGFYAGLHVSLLRVIPNCCITFVTYEWLLRWSKEQMQNRGKQ